MKYAIYEILEDISRENVPWESVNTGLRAVSAIIRHAQSYATQWDYPTVAYITDVSIDFAWRYVTNEPQIDYEAILRIWQDLTLPKWANYHLIALRNEMMDNPLRREMVLRTNHLINRSEEYQHAVPF